LTQLPPEIRDQGPPGEDDSAVFEADPAPDEAGAFEWSSGDDSARVWFPPDRVNRGR
jgi:hypothetical protein